jgi:hypothetical protein
MLAIPTLHASRPQEPQDVASGLVPGPPEAERECDLTLEPAAGRSYLFVR